MSFSLRGKKKKGKIMHITARRIEKFNNNQTTEGDK